MEDAALQFRYSAVTLAYNFGQGRLAGMPAVCAISTITDTRDLVRAVSDGVDLAPHATRGADTLFRRYDDPPIDTNEFARGAKRYREPLG